MTSPAATPPVPGRSITIPLHALFLASGALGLIYEVLWLRRFALLFGATAPATAATLAAVFTGWGLGSLAIGARCARWRRPLRTFGWLEAGVGAGALLVEPLLRAAQPLLAGMATALGEHPGLLLGVKTALAIVSILPATLLMGASLPVLGQVVAGNRGRLGVAAGGLYAVNTLGAAAGALAVPFALLPRLGAAGTTLAAAACSAAVGVAAWSLDAALERSGAAARQSPEVAPSGQNDGSGGAAGQGAISMGILSLAFLSGLLTLALETLAARAMAQVHENSVHSFAVVLAIFLIGLACGAGAARGLLQRGVNARRLLGVAWAGAGGYVLLTPRLFLWLSDGMNYAGGAGWDRGGIRLAWIALATLLPSALLCGVVLPALMEIAGGSAGRPAGPVLGRLLGANTGGAIAGPLLATFFVLPAVGLWWSLTFAGLAMALAGEWALSGPSGRGGALARLPRYAVIGLALLLLRPASVPRVRVEGGERLAWLADGPFGTVAVIESESQRRMKVDNFYLVGGNASTGEERLQAHIPLLLHPAPRRVAFLGLGTGVTAGAALLHPAVAEVTAVEIVPEVARASRDQFHDASLAFASDARTRVVLDDARQWLPAQDGAFDVIVGDLFVPWRRGEAALLTREQFGAVRRALAPGGLFCQWVPMYQMSEEDFRIVLRTFVDVFPGATLWHGDLRPDQPAIGLVARANGEPLQPDEADANSRAFARLGDPTNPYLSDPAGLWLYFIGPVDPHDPWLTGARINRDDRPWIELLTPASGAGSGRRGLVGRPATALLDRLRGSLRGGPAERLLGAARTGYRAAGRRLWEASLLGMEGRDEEADAVGLEVVSALPAPLQRAALGRVLCESDCPDPLSLPDPSASPSR